MMHITIPEEAITDFCEHHAIRTLALFGSALRDDFGAESDIDLLVEFEPGTKVTLLDMVAMEMELAEILGHRVDLRTAGDISRYFRQQVLENAVTLYERQR